MENRKEEVHFFLLSICCIVFDCSWQLKTFDEMQKTCVKRIHLVTDNDLYNQKAF